MDMKALKLDSAFRPLEVIDAIEALVMCIVGKALAVETYEQKLSSPSVTFSLPAVIVLKTVVKFRLTTVTCNRINIIWRDKNQCQYCANHFLTDQLTMDHVLPKSRGGKNTWENLVAACKRCNQKKGSRTKKESGMYPLKKPFRPKASILRTIGKNQVSDLWKNYLW
jgi:5-methylcytosine-specific restriction endonuclease McrA